MDYVVAELIENMDKVLRDALINIYYSTVYILGNCLLFAMS